MIQFRFPLTAGKIVAVMLLGLQLAGCVTPSLSGPNPNPDMPVTEAVTPRVVGLYKPADVALSCIRKTRALDGFVFNVGGVLDTTGKINAVSPGSTGAFLPGAGSAVFITDALKRAGGEVAVRYFGPGVETLTGGYTLNGVFTSLDFSTPFAADVRAGIGGIANYSVAMMTFTLQMDRAKNMTNAQISTIERPVRYTSLGAGLGDSFGGTLVTGQVQVGNQERLQFEAINGPIALAVADVLNKEFPKVRAHCGALIADILKQPATPVQVASGI